MKRALLIIFAMAVIFIGYSCKDDIVIQSSSEIRGGYIGEYKVVRNTTSGTQTKRARITWTFTDATYLYTIEEMISGNEICESTGDYELESRVTLTQTTYTPCVGVEADVPTGEFTLQKFALDGEDLDSLYLLQIVTDPDTGWTKELFLRPDTETVSSKY